MPLNMMKAPKMVIYKLQDNRHCGRFCKLEQSSAMTLRCSRTKARYLGPQNTYRCPFLEYRRWDLQYERIQNTRGSSCHICSRTKVQNQKQKQFLWRWGVLAVPNEAMGQLIEGTQRYTIFASILEAGQDTSQSRQNNATRSSFRGGGPPYFPIVVFQCTIAMMKSVYFAGKS